MLGDSPIHRNTLLRVVKTNGWLPAKGRTDVLKNFEVADVNELWIGDFLHGPAVRIGARTARAILCAVVDDHSRMIVGRAWSASEAIGTLPAVLKEAFLAYGIPKRLYVDNGPSFSCDLLARSCALAGISLGHSKPCDSPSRGKGRQRSWRRRAVAQQALRPHPIALSPPPLHQSTLDNRYFYPEDGAEKGSIGQEFILKDCYTLQHSAC